MITTRLSYQYEFISIYKGRHTRTLQACSLAFLRQGLSWNQPQPATVFVALSDAGNFTSSSNFPCILLNEIQTMFSQLLKQSSRQ